MQLNPSQAIVEIVDGQLRIEPFQSLWFNNSSAILVSKEMSGSFKVTAAVRSRSVANPGEPPPGLVRLGGLMVRNPDTSDGENYVFLVVGRDVNDVSIERKTTGPPQQHLCGKNVAYAIVAFSSFSLIRSPKLKERDTMRFDAPTF